MPRLRSWGFKRSRILQARFELLQNSYLSRLATSSRQSRRQILGPQVTLYGRSSLSSISRRRDTHNGRPEKWSPAERPADGHRSERNLDQIVAYSRFMKPGLMRGAQGNENWTSSESQIWKEAMKMDLTPYKNCQTSKRWIRALKLAGFSGHMPRHPLVRKRTRRKYLRRVWSSLDVGAKERCMQSALICALNHSPLFAFDIVQDLLENQIAVSRIVAQDVFARAGLITLAGLSSGPIHSSRAGVVFFRKVLDAIQLWSPKLPYTLSHDLMSDLGNRLGRHDLKRLFNTILANPNAHLTAWSICHLVKRAVELGLINIALKLLGRIPKEEVSHEAVQWACVRVLRLNLRKSKSRLHKLRLYILREVLNMDLVPNDKLRNVVIQTLMEDDDPDNAWAVFDNTTDRGLLPTVGTFFALLQRTQPSNFGEVFKVVQTAERFGSSTPAIGLHALLMLERLQTSRIGAIDSPFQCALRLYVCYYNLQPLVDIGFLDNESQIQLPTAGSPLIAPPVEVIAIMIRTFCQQYAGSLHLWNCYRSLMARICEGDPLFRRLASKPWVFEYFMAGMKSKKELLGACAQILQDMLDPSSPEKYISAGTTSNGLSSAAGGQNWPQELNAAESPAKEGSQKYPLDGIKVCKPRSTTWNILLQALLNSRELDSAEKLVELMQEEGFQPTLVTWNSLIGAFADSQKVDKVVSTIERIEWQNFEPDDRTRRNLKRVVDRQALIAALDRAQKERLL